MTPGVTGATANHHNSTFYIKYININIYNLNYIFMALIYKCHISRELYNRTRTKTLACLSVCVCVEMSPVVNQQD